MRKTRAVKAVKHKRTSFSNLWHSSDSWNHRLHNFILRFSKAKGGICCCSNNNYEDAYQEVIMITVLVRATLEWDCSLPLKPSALPLCPHLASLYCFLVLVLLLEQVPCVRFSTRGVNSPPSRSEENSLWQSHWLLLTLVQLLTQTDSQDNFFIVVFFFFLCWWKSQEKSLIEKILFGFGPTFFILVFTCTFSPKPWFSYWQTMLHSSVCFRNPFTQVATVRGEEKQLKSISVK